MWLGLLSENNINKQKREHRWGPNGLIGHAKVCQEGRCGHLLLIAPDGTLPAKPKMADFHYSEWWQNKCGLSNPPSLWRFITAAPTNDHSICEPSVTAYAMMPIQRPTYINGTISLAASCRPVSNTNCWFQLTVFIGITRSKLGYRPSVYQNISSSTCLDVCTVYSVNGLDCSEGGRMAQESFKLLPSAAFLCLTG